MVKPTKKRFKAWYKYRFPKNYGKDFDKNYQEEWEGRFRSPRYAWNSSDMQTRKSLIKFFPKTFKGLKISANLYNAEFGDKYKKW